MPGDEQQRSPTMKTSTTALAALLTAALGSTAIVPAAYAQSADDQVVIDQQVALDEVAFHPNGRDDRRGGPGGLLDLVCSPDGAEALEIALVRLDHRLDLTTAQQPLFDKLKASALTQQTAFADKCATARPDKNADTKPDLVERMKTRLTIDGARVEALTALLPDIEAFFGSLTDAQKAKLFPERGERMMKFRMMHRDDGPGHDGPGRH
jgi:hypothetical protein